MNDSTDDNVRKLQQQVGDLTELVAANRADIDQLTDRADAAHDRADKSEARADAADERADKSEARADAHHLRIDAIEGRLDVDEEMIRELQAEGVLSGNLAGQMQEALRSSRTIGTAIGVVRAYRKVSEEVAFATLAQASQDSNRKLRDIATEIVRDMDVSDLPQLSDPV